ncbi:hypothetical protein J0A67_01670 [Algoriphagus aestuariicola]|uniref:Lipocalin-like domain-containing protein n=1 Tax=Algoriphagus aestuariicola TaxID=1852016 RepID=A0ABS3BKT0_9BACT|nr:hypothetical protein [Algoriphagus aestuariicola]MBN7799546.1 hypothetical protein [Algoriphagus aestuariicola]
MTKHLKILLLLFLSSCGQSDQLDRKIIGTWTMEKVYEYENDVTEKHNPAQDRWIEFKSDGSFVSEGKPFGRNTGYWTADNEASILYIDSDVDDDDSEWSVAFDKNQTIWTGIGHPRKENTKLIHKRKE